MATVRQWWRDARGATTTLWALAYVSFLLVPILALSIEIGRYAEARTLIQSAADLAALAAAKEADFAHFQQTGEWRLLPSAHGVAQRYAADNIQLAGRQNIRARVTGVSVSGNLVRVALSADVNELFPFVERVTINVIGIAEMRIR